MTRRLASMAVATAVVVMGWPDRTLAPDMAILGPMFAMPMNFFGAALLANLSGPPARAQ